MSIYHLAYGCLGWPELKMKFELAGMVPPPKKLFCEFSPDDWKWEIFCRRMEYLHEKGKTDFSCMTTDDIFF